MDPRNKSVDDSSVSRWRTAINANSTVIAGLDPAIHGKSEIWCDNRYLDRVSMLAYAVNRHANQCLADHQPILNRTEVQQVRGSISKATPCIRQACHDCVTLHP